MEDSRIIHEKWTLSTKYIGSYLKPEIDSQSSTKSIFWKLQNDDYQSVVDWQPKD